MAKKKSTITNIEITSNKKEYLEALDEVIIKRVLTMWGHQAERAAQDLARVDTGLLRNSITYAIAGKAPKKTQYKAKKGDGTGSYSGNAPDDKKGTRSVYIGTNVEYAMAQEVGSFKDGSHSFLRPAIDENREYFRTILEEELKKAMTPDDQ